MSTKGDAGIRIIRQDAMMVKLIKRERWECRNSCGQIVSMGVLAVDGPTSSGEGKLLTTKLFSKNSVTFIVASCGHKLPSLFCARIAGSMTLGSTSSSLFRRARRGRTTNSVFTVVDSIWSCFDC